MKVKKAPVQQSSAAPEEDDEEVENEGENGGVPDFDDFLDTLDEEDENESEEEDGDEEDEDDEEEINGSSDEELAAALEASDDDEDNEGGSVDEEGEEDSLDDEGDDGSLEDIELEKDEEEQPQVEKSKKKLADKKKKVVNSAGEPNCELRPSAEESDDEAADDLTEESHKAALLKLEQSDPEFFAYLRDNDSQLLDFADEDDDDDSSDEEGQETNEKQKGKKGGTKGLHKPPENLEVASDSEAEEELIQEEPNAMQAKVAKFLKKGIVNLYVIADWEEKLSTTKDLSILSNVIEAFDCAVQSVLKEDAVSGLKWKVEGSSHFNALIRLCIRHLKGFCVRFLVGSNNQAVAETQFDKNPFDIKEKCKAKWTKLRPKIKLYMSALLEFLKSMGNPEAIASVLKHCQKMTGFFAIMATKSYKLLRVLITIWATGEDSCRVLAFLSIVRLANYNKTIFLTRIFKQMYMSYVANCKFTSANSWPSINFMRSSLVEVYLLDTAISYSVAFPFIRQLAIHLRNAVTAGTNQHVNQSKKEASRIVYSWQFVHSVHLWCDLLAQALGNGDDKLKLLVYPVVQICLGTIKLIPTRKYVPLRFHIVRMLINLQEKSKIFIPILPLATEVLHLTDFSSKTIKNFSVRPLNLLVCLKADASESGYFKAVSEGIFDTILGASKACCTELAFPEIVCPTLIYLKSFLKKKCRNSEVSKKFKTLIDKIEANSAYIRAKRAKAMEDGLVSLSDTKSQRILQAEMLVDTPGPPLLAFANEYFKTNARVAAKARSNHIQTREEKLIPRSSNKKSKAEKKSAKNLNSGVSMFSKSDSDDDSDQDTFATKLDQPAVVKRKRKPARDDDGEDDDMDLDLEDSEDEQIKPKKMKKKLKKSVKKPKPTPTFENFPDDVDDELVDLELSD